MSHKTLYIDIDEEITSIVDRVRKTPAGEVIIVVPKRALLIQSLVNLKLLKKESNRRRKRLMIVTQDKIGKKLIEKAGILVQGKIEGSLEQDDVFEIDPGKIQPEIMGEISEGEEENVFGSSDYFDEPLPEPPKNENIGKISYEKKGGESDLKADSGSVAQSAKASRAKISNVKAENRVKLSDIVAGPKKEKEKKPKVLKQVMPNKNEVPVPEEYFQKRELKRQKELKTEKFFQSSDFTPPSFSGRKNEKILKTTRIKGRSGKYFIVFLLAFVAFGAAAGAYFFLPRATIILHLKTQEKSVSMNLEANTQANGIDDQEKTIPAALEQITKEKSGEFEATGNQTGAGKATGRVVIFNEFSSEDQPLVVTTRLETEDGKIFRIAKGIVVPGFTRVGEETKPGAIEVEVMADKPGEEYNIEPASFKIPGFKGGPKYDKFHAESPKPMQGGQIGETASVSSQDLADAKAKLAAEARKEALEDLKGRLGGGRHFFEDTALFETTGSNSSEKVGSQAKKFTYTVSVKGRILSFQEDDVKQLIRQTESANSSNQIQVDFSKGMSYILSESDIENEFLKFEAKTDFDSASDLDISSFKEGALGKNSEELESIVKNYPAVKSADVKFWPFFASRVPMSKNRVKIEVQ